MVNKVLILGGNGYIGSRLNNHLLKLEYNVTNIDLGWFGISQPNTIEKDYRDLTTVLL